jgi:exopolyphosphatase/guanosine-5'-triphosphate,3'-diphosphate pyrophosphatase
MRVAVADVGTNSTRLLVAEVQDGQVTGQLAKQSEVTRLGEGVDASGRLGDEPMERVFRVLADYRRQADELSAHERYAVLTSAVRDADNGAEFTAAVRDRFGFDARTITGDTEARLTFAGATAGRDPDDPTPLVVIDIGGGSTELVEGSGGSMDFHVSTQAGVVRQTERHLHDDPPTPAQLERLAIEVRGIVLDKVPDAVLDAVGAGIAVAGTATQSAAIAQALEPYDPDKVHGYVLERSELDHLLERLGAVPLEERRKVPGMHPDRAPTIVAGVVILQQVLDAFALDRVEVSEHDILQGAAQTFCPRLQK